MSCPKCGGEQHCPCVNCVERSAGKVVWKWDETGELISCGHCGYTMHVDMWQDHEWEQLKKQEAQSSESGKQ